jgi:hypothetical protein
MSATETCPFREDSFTASHVLKNLVHGGHGDDEAVRQHNPDALFPNDPVLIRRVIGVVNAFVGFEQLDDRGENVTPHFNFREGKDERHAGLSPIDAPGEQVTKLAVSEFLNATVGAEAKVAPHITGRLELDAFDGTGRCGLETLIGIFVCDAGGDYVRFERPVIFLHEINGVGGVHVPPEKAWHFENVVQWNAHGDMPLRGGKIDPGNVFRHRMFDLEAEMIQEFDRAVSNVLDRLRQALGGPLQFVDR